ncbi:cell wall assembly and cell proliferation coordinating protein [Durotheca rogersii]|uniref:cell wall assembly and cell proliferation coordinating protein n=1 Tax=Durotheca rogersii TaxID=419775 RepID=UPI00221F70FC|nr:cell wall assembly and cell proliferation coordinating protein [Durotheca rogersii]KAI5862739.1 cell wall assembly and cell proliferation coordinating protein [Durotheca rogersii]
MSLGGAFRSFWHAMTTNDRHSTYDSPHRTGRHIPLNRQSTLTSVATASESRADITSPYVDELGRLSAGVDGATSLHPSPLSPGSNGPYSPGLRSSNAQRQSLKDDGFETVSSPGEIPMQSFSDGGPPAPPVVHSWKRIDKWAEENYPELFDQLCEGCTDNDLNELEHQLDCSLPQDVRDSLAVHDGQERGGRPTGIIFSSMLLDCEEIVQEWDQWRKVNQQYLLESSVAKPAVPSKAFGGSNQASSSKSAPGSPGSQKDSWRQELQARQDSVPEGAVQRSYAHPAWIPLVRDWGGNNLAVDLAPGLTGTWGQIILFGRDYDTKYVVAKSWAHFLGIVADDLNSGKWFVNEDSNELKLREFKTSRVEPSYFDILRWRMDQKHGRSAKVVAKRRSVLVGSATSPGGSPYAGPADGVGEPRGRTLQRLSNPSPLGSPVRPGFGKPAALARVTEEISTPDSHPSNNGVKQPKLVEVETPRPSDEIKQDVQVPVGAEATGKDSIPPHTATVVGDGDQGMDDGMKTIEI